MRRAAPTRDDGHQERSREEQGAEYGGGPGKRVRLAAPGHEAAGAPARAERATLRALQEDNDDKRDDDQNMNDDQNGLHEGLNRAKRLAAGPASSKDGALLTWRKGGVHREGAVTPEFRNFS